MTLRASLEKKKYYERQMEGKLDAVDSHEKRKKVKKKKKKVRALMKK